MTSSRQHCRMDISLNLSQVNFETAVVGNAGMDSKVWAAILSGWT